MWILNSKASDKISENKTIKSLENCAIQINNWMDTNRLKMNSSKTEFMYNGRAKQLIKVKSIKRY